jgi:hypothetical protein
LYASGQIKVSCYPFFDTAPATITTDKGVSKKGYFPTRRFTGGGATAILSQLARQAQKIKS